MYSSYISIIILQMSTNNLLKYLHNENMHYKTLTKHVFFRQRNFVSNNNCVLFKSLNYEY